MRIIHVLFLIMLCFLSACTTDNINKGAATPDDLYLAQVHKIMYNAWQQPSALADKQGLVTRVLVSVQQDGKIVQKEIVGASGNSLMDISVMTAVESVKDLPKPPSGVVCGFYKDITIDFKLNEPDEVNNLLAIPANSPDETIALRIKTVLEKDDVQIFAAMVKYPIRAGVNGHYSVIETPKQFADHYSEIIYPEFKKRVLESTPDDVWRKADDLAIGHGYVCLNDDKISAINNDWDEGSLSYLDPRGRAIIAPEGKKDYQKFMNRLVSKPSADFKQSDCVIKYTLYKADINNDKNSEFILTGMTEGVGHFTGIEGVWKESDGKLIRLPFEKAVAKSLDNNDPDFEWRHMMTYLAVPFLVIKDGTVYFGFDDYEYYVWKGDNIYRKDPCLPLCLP